MGKKASSACEKATRVVLLTVTAGVPLLMLPQASFDQFNTPKMSLLIAGLSLALALRLLAWVFGSQGTHAPLLLIPASAMFLPLLVSWSFSPYREWALNGQFFRYLGLFPYLLFVAYGLLMVDAFIGRPREIAWALAGAAGLTGLYAMTQAFHLDPLLEPSTFRGPLGLQPAVSTLANSKFAGAWHAMTFPITVALVASETGRRRDIAFFLAAFSLAGVFVSFSQGAWLALLTALVAMAGLRFARKPRSVIGAAVITIALTLSGVVMVSATLVSDRAVQLLGPTVEDRALGWETAYSIWKDDPLVGQGPNTMAISAYQHRSFSEAVHALDYTDDPHSVPLAFLANAGALGMLGYLVAVFWSLRRCVRIARGTGSFLALGFTASLIAYVTQALISIDVPSLRLAFWAVLSGCVAVGTKTLKDVNSPPRPRWKMAAASAFALLALSGLGLAWDWLRADQLMKHGQDAALDNRAEEADDAFDRALAYRDDVWYRHVAGTDIGELATRRGADGNLLFQKMQEHFDQARHIPTPGPLISEALLTYTWSVKVDPLFKTPALELFERAQQLDPGNLDAAVLLSDILANEGDLQRSLAVLLPFIPHEPLPANFWGRLALANARLGNQEAARHAIQRAFSLDETDAGATEASRILRGSK